MLANNSDPQSRRVARQRTVQKVIKYLGLSGTGIGISGIVGLLVNGQFRAAVVLGLFTIGVTAIAIAYKFISGVTNRVLDKIEEELENLEEPLAEWIVNQPKQFFTWWWWWKLNSQFQEKYYQSLIDTFRELKIEGFRIGLPVLDLKNVFVCLRVVPKIPEKITGSMIRQQVAPGNQAIWDFLAQSTKKKFQAFCRLAVIGPPGSGKTTLLKHLTLIYAKKENRNYKAPKLIPILLYLRDIRHLIVTEQPPSFPKLIREHIKNLPSTEPLMPPVNWIEDQLKIGKFLVMMDGLDEVANSEERTQVSEWVNRQMETYRRNVFILTSRPHGFKSAPVEQVGTVLEVLPFNSFQVKQFIQSWYLQTEIMSRAGRNTPAVRREANNNAEDLIERIMENRAIADMAKNPLLVTMIATVHYCGSALPGRRVELYQKICDLLLGTRQKAKKIKTPLTGEQNKSVLQVLALALMERKTRQFTLSQGQKLIQEELERVIGTKLIPSEFFKQIKELSGLLVERELGVYEFAHLSFQEYLAAARVKELQQDNLLTEKLHDPWWAETIRLYAAQGDATNLIRQAIANPTINSLTLALDCLQESLKVERSIREKLEAMLEEGLESDEPQIAKLAAEVKLSRRLNNLFEIEENLEIDTSYITYAEYQLFVDEWLKLRERFQPGSAAKPITEISRENAIAFCAWLSSAQLNDVEKGQANYYRLPTTTEIENYQAKEQKDLESWTIERRKTEKQGIRLVKAKLAPEYVGLVNCLSAREWEKAAEQTESVIRKMAGEGSQEEQKIWSMEQIAPEAFHIIELLWCQYSRGRNGWLSFEVIRFNNRGNITQWKPNQARYFLEDLGNWITLDMVYVPGGSFMMGTEEKEIERLVKKLKWERFRREKPQHQVTVQSFYMGKYPVTQAQWRAIAFLPKIKRDLKPDPSRFKGENLPVEQVSWEDAVEFCQRLSKHTGKEYRLPSEGDWEYACRAGTDAPFHYGETITGKLANYNANYTYAGESKGENRGETTPVGSFPPNAFGLYDMHGNVWEWCEDDWHDNYQGAPTDGISWVSGDDSTKVIRGGSWFINPVACRSAYRDDITRVGCSSDLGFRVVCVALKTT